MSMTQAIQLPAHPKCGTPSARFVYRDPSGRAILIANRFDRRDGSKFFIPFDMVANEWKAPSQRPLYHLDRILAADPAELVLLVEGEKCADALTGLGFLATTTYGGSNASSKTDLCALKGRKIVIWPDFDAAGNSYAIAVKSALNDLEGTQTSVLEINEDICRKTRKSAETGGHLSPIGAEMSGIPKGWDAADAINEGWEKSDILDLIAHFVGKSGQNPPLNKPEKPAFEGMELWHTPDKTTFATLCIDGHAEHWDLGSSHFRNYLSFQHFQSEGKALSQTALEDRRRTLAGEALFAGKEHAVFTRIGARDGETFLDLGSKDWSAVQITPSGWDVQRHPSVRFQRSGSLAALPTPTKGGSIEELRPFLNVGSETDFRMLVAWLMGAMQPKGPYPILILTGEQGSAKSTTARVLRSLVDPSNPMARSAPQSEQDLVIAARHNHVLAFDNLSHIKPTLADALCRIATGGGFGTRKLHTNCEEVLFDATRPCLLNGIPDLASRPDLADRSIIVTLPVIQETERQFEREFWTCFDAAAPRILGALLDAASNGLARMTSVTLHERPRMADFAKWVTAAEPVLGWPDGAFAEAYAANRRSVDQAAMEGNPLAEAISCLITQHGPWIGTATELINDLRDRYPQLTDDPQLFPRQPNRLSSELKRVQPLLRRHGIDLTKERRGKTGQRSIGIKKR
ncbi:MAG: hypothetical protein ACRBBT_03180 [Paracoccaceae bacterium]